MFEQGSQSSRPADDRGASLGPAGGQVRLRATQTLVSHMSFCWRHPSLTAMEVGWRWLFGIPFLLVLQAQLQQILLNISPDSAGLTHVNFQNPWVSSVLLSDAAELYRPAVLSVLRWLVPVALVLWAVVSGIGRTLLLHRMHKLDDTPTHPRFLRRIPAMIVLQGLWILGLLAAFWLWAAGVSWAAATHITSAQEPDLVGYLIWLILLSLSLYTAWALLSWTLAVAPILLLSEDCSLPAALLRSFHLGRTFSSKLLEINLVMSIVKIALIVLAMVFSAAPLPFSDQFGPDLLNVLYVAIAIAYLIANDYFQVVRLKSFQAFWLHYRVQEPGRELEFASSALIDAYAPLRDEFIEKILHVRAALLTDESSMWDFTMEPSLEPLYERIRQVYCVDVSDIERAVIWKILQRLGEQGKSRIL